MGLFIIRNENYVLNLLCFVLIISGGPVHARQLLSQTRPDPDNVAPFARWLVSQNSWGVLRFMISFRIFQITKMNLCDCVFLLLNFSYDFC
ncbi:hypothetical protein HanHA300_Chr17g0650761 [Helianthus annuus]|nr:hypothetical protein HanHA300_Chr17g0650761 [Helianthus annuus]KAJ0635983.1 hypothetical protein HanOQP8_Chr17g0656811 [Helianthus annuus]